MFHESASYWFYLQVVTDSGALALEHVLELIAEGVNLPVHAEQELQVKYEMNVNKAQHITLLLPKPVCLSWLINLQALRARSMLHCICRKPYNSRSMVSCSQCGEWYHTYCVKLHWRPKVYVCSACCPPLAESTPQIHPARFVPSAIQAYSKLHCYRLLFTLLSKATCHVGSVKT